MKKTLLALCAALAASAIPTIASAELAFNAGVVTDYRYRGISQTRLKPALQGGVDFTQGGLYLGAWGSTIKWIKDIPGGDSGIEIDLYGGYKGELANGVGYDVGVLAYVYPSNSLGPSANTTELYGAVTFGPVTAKYSHSVTDTFANPDSKNSWYLDVSASFDLGGGLMLAPHIGHQKFTGPVGAAATYTDYALTLSKDFSGLVPSVALVGTDADKGFYVPGANANSTKFLGKAALVVGLKYNF
jgi:uncharacterized protein (TIGR02001 family)